MECTRLHAEACAICAVRGTDEDFARIERAYRGMDAAGMDRVAYAEPDLQFHRGILIATGNDFLIAFGATVAAALRMSFDLSSTNPGAPRKSLPYHRAVLDEIWARNADGARQAMHKLMDLTEGNIVATAGWELGGPGPMIYVFSPSGEVKEMHPVPCRRPTNCAFGGDRLSDLYVTSIEGFLLRTPTGRQGRPLWAGVKR